MKRDWSARLIAGVVLGDLLGLYLRGYQAKWSRLGIDAYLAHYRAYFAMHVVRPRPLIASLAIGIFEALMVLLFYELVVAGLRLLIVPRRKTGRV